MKKLVSMLAVVTFLFSMSLNAQEKVKEAPKAKTEKSCTKEEKKSCDAKSSKKSCCAAKKVEKAEEVK